MKITFLGHACFLLEDGTHQVLTDPFHTGNGLAAASPQDLNPDFIFVTHGHSDHTGDAEAIAKRTGAPICCTVDLADAVFDPAGLSVLVGNIGGTLSLPFGSAKMVSAIHGSGVPGGLACGFPSEISLPWDPPMHCRPSA